MILAYLRCGSCLTMLARSLQARHCSMESCWHALLYTSQSKLRCLPAAAHEYFWSSQPSYKSRNGKVPSGSEQTSDVQQVANGTYKTLVIICLVPQRPHIFQNEFIQAAESISLQTSPLLSTHATSSSSGRISGTGPTGVIPNGLIWVWLFV